MQHFSTAFLQGNYIDRKSDFVLAPPHGYAAAGIAWRLKKPVYGLCSAPKSWYDRVREVATAAGLDCDVSDEAVFRLFVSIGSNLGILALHVDDTIGGGTPALLDAMRLTGSVLKIGAEEFAKDVPLLHAGLRISTCPITHGKQKGKFAIPVDGNEYLQATKEMDVRSGDTNDLLSPVAATDFRSVAGCIGYMAFSFRPELAVECSMLGRVFLSRSITDARKVCATLAWAKANPYVLKYLAGAKRLIGFADSAGPSPRGTQGGRPFALTDKDGFQVCAWIYWESRNVKRVCSSSNTGDLMSCTEAFDTSMWLQQLWFELTGNKVPVELVIDSHGTSQNATTTSLPAEQRSRTDMSKLRQGLRRGEYILTWIRGRATLSDPMTKEIFGKGGSPLSPCERLKRPLLDALRTNNTNLNGVKRVTKTQADVSKY